MDKLLAYLNSLSTDEQLSFAKQCMTSIGYLRKAVSKGQLLGATLCVAIEQATGGQVTRKDLRPDDWPLIWPELNVAAQPAQPQSQPTPSIEFGGLGEPRSGVDRREEDRRTHADPSHGEFGEPRDGDRRVCDRRKTNCG